MILMNIGACFCTLTEVTTSATEIKSYTYEKKQRELLLLLLLSEHLYSALSLTISNAL